MWFYNVSGLVIIFTSVVFMQRARALYFEKFKHFIVLLVFFLRVEMITKLSSLKPSKCNEFHILRLRKNRYFLFNGNKVKYKI